MLFNFMFFFCYLQRLLELSYVKVKGNPFLNNFIMNVIQLCL